VLSLILGHISVLSSNLSCIIASCTEYWHKTIQQQLFAPSWLHQSHPGYDVKLYQTFILDMMINFLHVVCATMAALTPKIILLDFCTSQLHSLVNYKQVFALIMA